MPTKARFKTTIRLGAGHSEMLAVAPSGERIALPLDKATSSDLHALAGTLCQLHNVTGKPTSRPYSQPRHSPRVRIEDLARAMTQAVENFWRRPSEPVLLRGGLPYGA